MKDGEEGESLSDKLARLKMERKAAAEERSRARQADKAYFENKKKETEEAAKEKKEREEKSLEERKLTDEDKGREEKLREKMSGGMFGESGGGGGEVDANDPFALKGAKKFGGRVV